MNPDETERVQGLLSVVVPAYEEQENIAVTLGGLRSGLEEGFPSRPIELIVVDDGSQDETVRCAREGGADDVISLGRNRGKGAAVRTGMLSAKGSVLLYTDADMPYPPEVMVDLVQRVDAGALAVIGVRRTNTASLKRRLGSRLINVLAGLLVLGRRHPDTQCGLKVFEGGTAKDVFGRCRVDRFGFDAEVLLLLDRLGVSVVEVPVDVLPPLRESKVRVFQDGLRMLRDLLSTRRRARRGEYDSPVAAVAGGSD